MTLHLCYRKIENLNFFTYSDSFDKKKIFEYIKTFKNKEILNLTDEQIDVLLDVLKVTFLNDKWKLLKLFEIRKSNFSAKESIVRMKINVLFLRAKYRDYYAIYFLAKSGISLRKVFEYSLNVFDGINLKLFSVTLLYTNDIENYNISKEKIRYFFEKKLR